MQSFHIGVDSKYFCWFVCWFTFFSAAASKLLRTRTGLACFSLLLNSFRQREEKHFLPVSNCCDELRSSRCMRFTVWLSAFLNACISFLFLSSALLQTKSSGVNWRSECTSSMWLVGSSNCVYTAHSNTAYKTHQKAGKEMYLTLPSAVEVC